MPFTPDHGTPAGAPAAPQPLRPARRFATFPHSSAARWTLGVLALLAGALVAAELAGWPFLRGPVQQQLQQRLGAPVELLAPFQLRLLLNPGVRVAGVTLGAPAGLQVPHLLQADNLDLRWRASEAWRLLTGAEPGAPLQLRSLAASRLDVHLLRLADGRASWPATPQPVDGAAPQPRLQSLPVQVESLALQDGRIDYRDALTRSDLQARVQAGQGEGSSNGFEASVQGRWQDKAVRLQASAGGVMPLFDANSATAMPPVSLQGRIGETEFSFRGVAADLLSARALRGSLLVRGPSLASVGDALGVTLPTTPPFRLDTALSHDGGLWTVSTSRAQVGGSRLQAQLVYDSRPATPLLTGRLGGELLRLKDLGPAIGTPIPADAPRLPAVLDAAEILDANAGAPAARQAAGPGEKPGETRGPTGGTARSETAQAPRRPDRVLPDRRFDLPTLRVMDADVQVAIRTLDLGDDAAIEPLRDLATHLTLRQGVLTLDELKARAAGGQFSGTTTLDAADVGKPARWQADLRFAGMKIEDWLRALQREGRPLLSGRLAARFQVRGVGSSTAQLLSTLQGQAVARISQGQVSHLVLELAGLDVAQALGVMLRGDRSLPLSCFDVRTRIDAGVMRAVHAVADTRDSTVRVDGQLNLGDETLALRAVAQPKDFSPLSLRTPVLVGGTLADPVVGIEGRRLLPRLAVALGLAAAAGPAGLLPFLEFGSEPSGEADPCQPAR